MLGHSGFGSVLGARECFGNLARPRTACFARQEQVIRWCRSAPNKRFAGVVLEIAPGPVRGWRVLCARTSESSRSLRKLFRGVVASLLAVGRALLAVGSVVASSNTASILMRPLGAQHHTGYSEVQKLPITHGKRALRLAPARRASSRRSLSLSRWRTCTGTSQSLWIAGPSRRSRGPPPPTFSHEILARRGPAPRVLRQRRFCSQDKRPDSECASATLPARWLMPRSMRPPPGWPSEAS